VQDIEDEMENWVIVCSKCGGVDRDLISRRLGSALEEYMASRDVNVTSVKVAMKSIPIVDSNWIIDSVTNFEIMPFRNYSVE
jgi:hypothetical protein